MDPALLTFNSAFKLFKNGASAAEIYKLLTSKVPKFKVALEAAGFTKPCGSVVEIHSTASLLEENKV